MHDNSVQDRSAKKSHEEHGNGEIERVVVKKNTLNAILAAEMNKNGIQCEAVEIGSNSLEKAPHSSYTFALSSRLVTNRGLIRLKGKNLDFVQVLQRI